jgi:hypothetical protein
LGMSLSQYGNFVGYWFFPLCQVGVFLRFWMWLDLTWHELWAGQGFDVGYPSYIRLLSTWVANVMSRQVSIRKSHHIAFHHSFTPRKYSHKNPTPPFQSPSSSSNNSIPYLSTFTQCWSRRCRSGNGFSSEVQHFNQPHHITSLPSCTVCRSTNQTRQ